MARDEGIDTYQKEYDTLYGRLSEQLERLNEFGEQDIIGLGDIKALTEEIKTQIGSLKFKADDSSDPAANLKELNDHLKNFTNKVDYFANMNKRLLSQKNVGEQLSFTGDMKNQFTDLLLEAKNLNQKYATLLERFAGDLLNGIGHLRGERDNKTQRDENTPVYATEERIKKEQDRYALVKYGFQTTLDEYALKHGKNYEMMALHDVATNLFKHANRVASSTLSNNHEVMTLINHDLHNATGFLHAANKENLDASIKALQQMNEKRPEISEVSQVNDRTWQAYLYSQLTFRNVAIFVTLAAVGGSIIFFTGGLGIPLLVPLCASGPALLSAGVGAALSGAAIGAGYAAFAAQWMMHGLSSALAFANPAVAVNFLANAGLGKEGAIVVYGLAALSAVMTVGYGAARLLGTAYNAVAGRSSNDVAGMEEAEEDLEKSEWLTGPGSVISSLQDLTGEELSELEQQQQQTTNYRSLMTTGRKEREEPTADENNTQVRENPIRPR